MTHGRSSVLVAGSLGNVLGLLKSLKTAAVAFEWCISPLVHTATARGRLLACYWMTPSTALTCDGYKTRNAVANRNQPISDQMGWFLVATKSQPIQPNTMEKPNCTSAKNKFLNVAQNLELMSLTLAEIASTVHDVRSLPTDPHRRTPHLASRKLGFGSLRVGGLQQHLAVETCPRSFSSWFV